MTEQQNITTTEAVVDNNQTTNIPKKHNVKAIFKHVIFSVLLFLLICIIFQVPYIGSVLDAIFFEFLFGWTKIILYAICILGLMSMYIKKIQTLFTNKCVILISLFIYITIAFVIESVVYYKDMISTSSLKELFVGNNGYITLWYNKILLASTSSKVIYADLILLKPFSYGGLLFLSIFALCFVALPLFIIIVCILFGTIFIAIMYKTKWFIKFKNKLIKWLGGYTNKDINIVSNNDHNYLTDDMDDKNKIDDPKIDNLINIVNKYLIDNKIIKKIEYSPKTYMYANFAILIYPIKYNVFSQITNDVIEVNSHNYNFYWWKDNTNLYVKVYTYDLIKIPFDKLLTNNDTWNNIPLGLGTNSNIIYNNLLLGNLCIHGAKGSGYSMLLSQIILYYQHINKHQNFNIKMLSTNPRHIKNDNISIINSIDELKSFLEKFDNEYKAKILDLNNTILIIDEQFVTNEIIDLIQKYYYLFNINLFLIMNIGNNTLYKDMNKIKFNHVVFSLPDQQINIAKKDFYLKCLTSKGEFLYINTNLETSYGQISFIK